MPLTLLGTQSRITRSTSLVRSGRTDVRSRARQGRAFSGGGEGVKVMPKKEGAPGRGVFGGRKVGYGDFLDPNQASRHYRTD